MTNSLDARSRAMKALDAMESLLSDEVVAARVNTPIDQAVASFQFDWEPPFSNGRFLEVIGEFMDHVWSWTGEIGNSSASARKGEAISLLIRHYRGIHETGYDGAILDAMASFDPLCDGIDVVLMNMADLLKATRRQEYTDWVYVRFLDPFDRELLYDIVATIQEQNRDLLPPDILAAEPFELADQIPYLLDTLREVRAIESQVRSGVSNLSEPSVMRRSPSASAKPLMGVIAQRYFTLR